MPRRKKKERARKTPRRSIGFWDRFWLRRGRSIRVPERVQRVFRVFVQLGDGWLWIAVALLLGLILPFGLFARAAVTALMAAAISLPLYWIVKAAFRRARPYTLFKWISPGVSPRDKYSFPSGHTMNNMAVAVGLALHVPWLWPLALGVPLSLGLLRVFFGVHFLSDIVAGALLGFGSALAAYGLYAAFLPGLGG